MTRPDGLYLGVDHDEYHDDPALSSTGARHLTPPSCPAKFRWNADNRRERKVTPAMEFGQAYHTLAFDAGPEIVIIDAPDWRTKAAQAERDEARAAGKVPLLAYEHRKVQAMAAILRADTTFRALTVDGAPEVSLWWHDDHDVQCRARTDWLPEIRKGQRLILPDWKTTTSAHPETFGAKSMQRYGYAQQADWYTRGFRALDLADDALMLFAAQETEPPYVLQWIQPDADAMRVGRILNDRALETFARCTETNTWGGYADGIALASLPGWYANPIIESELTA